MDICLFLTDEDPESVITLAWEDAGSNATKAARFTCRREGGHHRRPVLHPQEGTGNIEGATVELPGEEITIPHAKDPYRSNLDHTPSCMAKQPPEPQQTEDDPRWVRLNRLAQKTWMTFRREYGRPPEFLLICGELAANWTEAAPYAKQLPSALIFRNGKLRPDLPTGIIAV